MCLHTKDTSTGQPTAGRSKLPSAAGVFRIKRFSDLPTLSHLRHVSGNKAIFILRLTLKNAKFCFDKSVNLGRLLIFDTLTVLKINLRIFFYKTCFYLMLPLFSAYFYCPALMSF